MSSNAQAGGPIWRDIPGEPGSGKQVLTTFQYSTDDGVTWNYAPADPRSINFHRGDGKQNSLVESLIALMGSGHATYATGLDRPYIAIYNRQDRWPTSLPADRTMSALKRHCVTDQLEGYGVPVDLPVQYVRRQTLDGQETKSRFLLTGTLQAVTEGSTPPPERTPVSGVPTDVTSGPSGSQPTTGPCISRTDPRYAQDVTAVPSLEVTCEFRVKGDGPSVQADWITLQYPAGNTVGSTTNVDKNKAPRKYSWPTGKAWVSHLAPLYDPSIILSDDAQLSKEAVRRRQLAITAFHNRMKPLEARLDHWDFGKGNFEHYFSTQAIGGQALECRITFHDPPSAIPNTSSHANDQPERTSLVGPWGAG